MNRISGLTTPKVTGQQVIDYLKGIKRKVASGKLAKETGLARIAQYGIRNKLNAAMISKAFVAASFEEFKEDPRAVANQLHGKN